MITHWDISQLQRRSVMTAHIDEFLGHRLHALDPDSAERISVLLVVKSTWKLPDALQDEVQITSTVGDVLCCNMTSRAIRLLEQDPLVTSIT